ncbi:MAG TPA: hypothetical protein VD837_02295 [Terriglobales bacterium]|nr:hypothetical protein [Terriglobales bacterium]
MYSIYLVSAFIAGALCGAALTTMQRHAKLERLKAEFREELNAMCNDNFTAPAGTKNAVQDHIPRPRSVADELPDFASGSHDLWMPIPSPTAGAEPNRIRP